MHLFPESHYLRVSFMICRDLTHDIGFLEVGNDTDAPKSPSSLPSSAIKRRPWRTTKSQQPKLLNCDFSVLQFRTVFFVNGSLVKAPLFGGKKKKEKTFINSFTLAHFQSAIIKSNVNICLQLRHHYICSVQKVQVKRDDQLLHLAWWSLNDLMSQAMSLTSFVEKAMCKDSIIRGAPTTAAAQALRLRAMRHG